MPMELPQLPRPPHNNNIRIKVVQLSKPQPPRLLPQHKSIRIRKIQLLLSEPQPQPPIHCAVFNSLIYKPPNLFTVYVM